LRSRVVRRIDIGSIDPRSDCSDCWIFYCRYRTRYDRADRIQCGRKHHDDAVECGIGDGDNGWLLRVLLWPAGDRFHFRFRNAEVRIAPRVALVFPDDLVRGSLQASVIVESTYRPVPYLTNGHLETIVPSAFRKITGVLYQRQRLELADGDFLDLDWLRHSDVVTDFAKPTSGETKKLVIISHGLEGSSERHYSRGMSKYFYARGWDTLAWNCRSCSGELNRLPRFYHHGDTADLQHVIDEAFRKEYNHIALVGFSMGGSFSMKYLGERGSNIDKRIKGGVGFSVPCDLGSSAAELDKPSKSFYRNPFLRKLGKKILAKSFIYPGKISFKDYNQVKTFRQFDDRYTASLHGFKDANDFYSKSSCDQYLKNIVVPALIVNAANDPFLTPDCYPDIPNVQLEIPKHGGHVGFPLAKTEENYMERRAYDFLS